MKYNLVDELRDHQFEIIDEDGHAHDVNVFWKEILADGPCLHVTRQWGPYGETDVFNLVISTDTKEDYNQLFSQLIELVSEWHWGGGRFQLLNANHSDSGTHGFFQIKDKSIKS